MIQFFITVVIPAYNASAYIAEAIESVRGQTYPRPCEIVVIDDGSTDGTASVVHRLSGDIRYVRQDNAGPAAALNHGLAVAQGDLISFLSADDVWVPEKLAWQVEALSAPGTDLVFGHMQHFISPELTPEEAGKLKCPPEPMPAYSAGTLLTKRETFQAVGKFNESFRTGEFIDWYGRAVDLGLNIRMLPQVVSRRRVHGSNHSLTAKAPQSYAQVLKATLDRRRGLANK